MTDFRTSPTEATRTEPSGWAAGGVIFAATMMILIGIFQALEGLAAIIDDEFFVVLPNYTFDLDTTAWGWVHLIVGILIAVAGFYLFTGSAIAGAVAIALASVSAITNFFFIPYYPFWSLLIIAINVFVIWSITRSGIMSSR
ncbi:DUF7144 family membrane protein [Jiangella rhizosphaerae]|uniref:DUF7144 domain-containing protein n=1 Tax=Jiangella rhizosphaerae TaxID=2293569 RepID=A0A418KJD1_9ACTN|nr:hypothetical protein [Jiangella rhizosphaerae]RIQ13752.1 hypothetical protein DY240_25205 [Jiangella rhizosphaerae]